MYTCMNIDPSVHQLMKYSLEELYSSEPYEKNSKLGYQ